MENKKITKKEYFNTVLELIKSTGYETEDISHEKLIAMTEHEIELINRKRTKSKDSRKTEENKRTAQEIITYLQDNPNLIMTPSDIAEWLAVQHTGTDWSVPKVSAVMKHTENEVKKFQVRKKVHYQLKGGEGA